MGGGRENRAVGADGEKAPLVLKNTEQLKARLFFVRYRLLHVFVSGCVHLFLSVITLCLLL